MPDFFDPNEQQPGQPRISDSGIGYYKSLLENPAWCEQNPAQASFLKTTVDGALAATGQSLDPPQDTRSPAQKMHDHVTPQSHTGLTNIATFPRHIASSLRLFHCRRTLL